MKDYFKHIMYSNFGVFIFGFTFGGMVGVAIGIICWLTAGGA